MQSADARKRTIYRIVMSTILFGLALTLFWIGAKAIRPTAVAATDSAGSTVTATDDATTDAKLTTDKKSSTAQQDMKWIWSPAQPLEKSVPPGECYFRKSFSLGQPESGEVQISCDNA